MHVDPRQDPVIAGQPPAAPRATPALPAPTVGRLDGMSSTQLRARFDELQNQRQLLADRRANVAGSYERATGISKEGIGARLSVMDKSMVQIESDLASVGQAMVNRPQTGSLFPPGLPNQGRTRNVPAAEVVVVGFGVFLATMVIAVPAAVRRAKRRWLRESPHAGTANIAGASDRLDRIEHAVDAIAIEIERVSENQRFMTRLMTETQLAGTLAAVRNSAEAGKSIADKGS